MFGGFDNDATDPITDLSEFDDEDSTDVAGVDEEDQADDNKTTADDVNIKDKIIKEFDSLKDAPAENKA